MTGFDTAAGLRGRLADRAAVWDFLRVFATAWDLPVAPAVAPERLGPRPPAALREAYACGTPLDPRGASVEGGVLEFHWADPLVAETAWGIPLDGVDLDDPPVVVDTGSGWRPYADRLSLACLDFALTAALEHPDAPANACELPPEQVPAAVAALDRLPLPDLPMWVELEQSPVRWYSTPGGLLRTHGNDWVWLWVRAQTTADLDAVCASLPEARWSQ
jgi:hypothetical protein